jgi:hypothetical protein
MCARVAADILSYISLITTLGTWAEDHTLEELKGLGTGLGSGLDHNRDK